MPFKNLTGLKKLTGLGAEVVGIAPLYTGQIIAAVTSDPVKLSVHPIAGGTGKVTNVALDEANDAALLNKQVAVVKSGDDLWALLDIQHRPKVEQVGRDIKSLYASPAGETALAIGWDGNGASLAFANNEVGGRQFVLRGDIRAASIADDRCYVVVEGGAGGQFRVHPGTTPESGAIGRVDLPGEAAGFDRLAGGDALSALSGRGADTVCIVQRAGASYHTKVIHVPGGVVDVAVIETSLFVLGADGKLRLYASAALSGDAQPTFELSLRADGQPTVLTATQKGGNRLWIGSKAGDVIMCAAVKGGLDV